MVAHLVARKTLSDEDKRELKKLLRQAGTSGDKS
jgi:hypothetical protein